MPVRSDPATARNAELIAASLSTEQALQLGLLHRHVDAQELDAAVEAEIVLLLQVAPLAQQTAKKLIRATSLPGAGQRDLQAARNAKLLAQLHSSDEGREGLQAFLQKRRSDWSH